MPHRCEKHMGMILGFALFVGALISTVVSVVLCVLAIVMIRKASHERLNVWPLSVAGFVVCLSALLFVISYYPFASVSPGTDYDVTMKNFFLQGILYGVSPGVAAILALLSTGLGRRKPERITRHKTHST